MNCFISLRQKKISFVLIEEDNRQLNIIVHLLFMLLSLDLGHAIGTSPEIYETVLSQNYDLPVAKEHYIRNLNEDFALQEMIYMA